MTATQEGVDIPFKSTGGYCACDNDGPHRLVARLFDDEGFETEVIGNIYEHPDLLKQEAPCPQ